MSLKKFIQSFSFEIITIFTVGLLSLTWYKGAEFLGVGDFGIRFDREKYLSLLTSSWDWAVSFGAASPTQLAQFMPYGLVAFVTNLVSIPLHFVEKFWIYWWFVASGLFSLLFLKELGYQRIGRMSGALLYMMNPFAALVIWHLPHGRIQEPYAYTPLVALLYLKIIKEEWSSKHAMFIALLVALVTVSYSGPNYLIIHFFPVAVMLVLLLTKRDYSISQKLRMVSKACISIAIFIAASAFWLLPFLMQRDSVLSNSTLSGIISNQEAYKLASVSFLSSIRLVGLWSIDAFYKGDPYYSWNWLWNMVWYQITLFSIPFFVACAFLGRKINFRLAFFGTIYVISLFLVKGAQQPLPQINDWIYGLSDLISAGFRSPYLKFGILLSFSTAGLFGIGVERASEIFNTRRWRFSLVAIVIVLLALINIPFLNGDVIYKGGKIAKSFRITIPQEYYELSNFFKQTGRIGRVIILPLSKTNKTFVKWYTGGYFDKWFTGQHPTINADTGGRSYTLPTAFAKLVEGGSDDSRVYELLFSLMNVRYILIHKDADWPYIASHSWYFDHTEEKVGDFANLIKTVTEKMLDNKNLSVLERKNFLDKEIYIPKKVWTFSGNKEDLLSFIRISYITANDAFVFADDIKKQNSIGPILSLPTIQKNEGYPLVQDIQYKISTSSSETDLYALPDLEYGGIRGDMGIKDNLYVFEPKSIALRVNDENRLLNFPSKLSIPIDRTITFAQINTQVCAVRTANCSVRLYSQNQSTTYRTLSQSSLSPLELDKRSELIDASNKDPGEAKIKKVVLKEGGEDVLRLSSSNHTLALKLPFESQQNASIIVGLSYKNNTAQPLQAAFVASGKKRDLSISSLPINSKNETVYLSFSDKGARGTLYLYLRGDEGKEATVDIYNVKISTVASVTTTKFKFVPEQVLVSSKLPSNDTNITIPFSENAKVKLYDSFDNLKTESILDASISLPGDPGFSARVVKNSDADSSLLLETKNHTVGYRLRAALPSDNPRGKYILRFRYKNNEGEKPRVSLIQRGAMNSAQQKFQLTDADSTWRVFEEVVYVRDESVQNIDVYLYSDKGSISKTVNQFDDVSLSKYEMPHHIFAISSSVAKKTDLSTIESTVRESPTSFIVYLRKVSTSTSIVFSESYSQQWVATIGGQRLEDKFIANGYGNGWLIEPDYFCINNDSCHKNEDGSWNISLKIVYLGQRWFKIGILLSVVSILFSGLFFSKGTRRKIYEICFKKV